MVAAAAILNQPKVDSYLEPVEPTAHDLTSIEFFSGIGLTHLGLSPHGWNCAYANDIEPKKKRMYEARFGRADYYHVEDVWRTDRIIARIPDRPVDLATASFPCVDLSLAGNLRGFSGSQSGAFYGFIKVMKKLREQRRAPRAVLVENVIGFLSSHDGKFFEIALQQLADLGYFLDAFVVDAKHFVPQSRPRLFIVGFEKSLMPTKRYQYYLFDGEGFDSFRENPEPFEGSLRPRRLLEKLSGVRLKTGWVPLRLPQLPRENRNLAACIDTDDAQDWWTEWRVKKHLAEMHPTHLRRVRALKRGDVVSVGTIYRRVREGKSRSEIRTDGLAGCLRTPRGGSSKQIVFTAGQGKVRMRWMSPREYARLQGCPDYPIEVTRNEALWGFGDAVCVPVIDWIAENVLSQLLTARSSESLQATGD
ncbi:MAG TPA: DNA (cytosine-5-)-methyltransferase [Terriglobales bacterium]|nr:DNA (cytosine-5-)-methyltransferase [Terriglobales bacterium]